MSKKLGVKIPPGGISPNLIKNFPLTFLLEDRFLLDLGEIYSLLGLMKLAPGVKLTRAEIAFVENRRQKSLFGNDTLQSSRSKTPGFHSMDLGPIQSTFANLLRV